MWQPISTAPYDRDVELAVIDHGDEHALVFPCRRKGTDIWIDALTGRTIEVQPTHWREWSEKNPRDRLH
jgi:hypothetical protein